MFRSITLVAALSLGAQAPLPAAQPAEPTARERARESGRSARGLSLDVPYVPQTPDLCGGAAIAMVYRCWGDAHAGAEQFAPLVDRRAGGIADHVLVDAVRRQGWQADRMSGSLEALRLQVDRRRPTIVLLQDEPGRPERRRGARFHYVVVTGADAGGVIIHDPSWGPSRRIPVEDFVRAWRADWLLGARRAARRRGLEEAVERFLGEYCGRSGSPQRLL